MNDCTKLYFFKKEKAEETLNYLKNLASYRYFVTVRDLEDYLKCNISDLPNKHFGWYSSDLSFAKIKYGESFWFIEIDGEGEGYWFIEIVRPHMPITSTNTSIRDEIVNIMSKFNMYSYGREKTKTVFNYNIQYKKEKNTMKIKNVIFNDPATIVFWEDGTKTVVKCGKNDIYDKEKGLAMAISKRALGDRGSYYNEFSKWLPVGYVPSEKVELIYSHDTKPIAELASVKLTNNGLEIKYKPKHTYSRTADEIVELFEDLLKKKNIRVPCADDEDEWERQNTDTDAKLYGAEYWELRDKIEEILRKDGK